MNKIIIGLILSISVLFSNNDIQEIAKFADEICGSIETKGNMEKTDINISFSDKNKEQIIKFLKDAGFEDIKIDDNKIIQKTYRFTGVPREDLSGTMSKIRRCKIQVLKNMIE